MIHNFAVFEGGDGSGTSTQMEMLKQRFDRKKEGTGKGALPPLHATFEPTAGPVGSLIRRALRGEIALEKETLARLFAADRNEHLYAKDGVITRAGQGELVVSDRYVLSSLVYQGLDCGEELPRLLNAGFPLPETVIFFDLDAKTALERLGKRPVRDCYEYLEFQVQVGRRYRELLSRYEDEGVLVSRIDAAAPVEKVADEVWGALKKMPILKQSLCGN